MTLPTALDQLLMKAIAVNGAAAPMRTTLALDGDGVTYTDDATNDQTVVTIAPPGGGWQTALEIDFTAQGSQAFASDGTYSFAGYTWTKLRSVSDEVALANVSGTGLVIQPASGGVSAGAFSAPRIALALNAVLPSGFDMDWPLRVVAQTTAITSSSNAGAIVGLAPIDTSGGGSSARLFYVVQKGNVDEFSLQLLQTGSSVEQDYADSSAYSAYDSIVAYFPGGLAGCQLVGLACSALAAPLYWFGSAMASYSVGSDSGLAGGSTPWGVHLAATGDGCSATFTKLRVDYLAR